jgi:hypothetical protein
VNIHALRQRNRHRDGGGAMRTVLVALYLLLISLSSAWAEDIPRSAIKLVKTSLVPLVCALKSENPTPTPSVVATGFFVDRLGDIVTAAHVVEGFATFNTLSHPCNALALVVRFGGWTEGESDLNGALFWLDCQERQTEDIATCKTEGNPFDTASVKGVIAPVVFATMLQHDGTPAAFTGFALDGFPITSKANVAANGLGHVLKYPDPKPMLVLDKTAPAGYSGCPVYIADGSVIGMIVQSSEQPGVEGSIGFAFARPSKAIVAYLTGLGIKVKTVKGEP